MSESAKREGGGIEILPVQGRTPEEIRAAAAARGLRLPPAEWIDLATRLGRDPSVPEAYLFDVALSEHCSYKSSRRFLKKYLPPLSREVLLGPGEDSGIVSLGVHGGEEWGLVVAHESHNHPSQVLPVEGAATGIGGIVRDVYCMGADVVGVLDGLRFGDPEGAHAARTRAIARGVVQGISEYGNALGVPNLGGDTWFHPGFDDNCLVNVVALGVLPVRRIVRSRVPAVAGVPFVLVLVGKPTDDTGLGGASFASQILDDADAGENRGAVQIHDPFLKRVLAEATLEAWDWLERNRIPVGCKDLGAAGLGGASSELVIAAGRGAEIDLSAIPVGLAGLAPEQILCAETQERFVWAVPADRAAELCELFNRDFELGRCYPGAAARVIGRVLDEPVYRCLFEGKVVVELPTAILEEPPALHRPTAPRPAAPPPADPPPPGPDVAAWAKERLTGWDAAARAPIFRFYDQEVRGEALLRPGEAGAGVCRPVPGSDLGVAVSLDGNPHYGRLDPYWAGALAVLESARNVIGVGARPVCLTDCLNFGSPEDPVCLGDFEEALRGMHDACLALAECTATREPLPVISGNVSFYNQSATGKAIPPSPIVCCYGVLDDYGTAVTARLKQAGDLLLLTGRRERAWGSPAGGAGGRVPRPDLAQQGRELRAVLQLIDEGNVRAAQDVADGGLLRAVWEMVALEDEPGALGAEIDLASLSRTGGEGMEAHELLLSESPGYLLEVDPGRALVLLPFLEAAGVPCAVVGRVIDRPAVRAGRDGTWWLDLRIEETHRAWRDRLRGVTENGPDPDRPDAGPDAGGEGN